MDPGPGGVGAVSWAILASFGALALLLGLIPTSGWRPLRQSETANDSTRVAVRRPSEQTLVPKRDVTRVALALHGVGADQKLVRPEP